MWYHRHNKDEILRVDQCLTALLDEINKLAINEPRLMLLEFLNVDLYFSGRIEAEVRLSGLVNLQRLANCYQGIIIEPYQHTRVRLHYYHIFYAKYNNVNIEQAYSFCRVFEPTFYIQEIQDGFVLIHEGRERIPELPEFLQEPEILIYHDRKPVELQNLPCKPRRASIRVPSVIHCGLDLTAYRQAHIVLRDKILSTEDEDPHLLDQLLH